MPPFPFLKFQQNGIINKKRSVENKGNSYTSHGSIEKLGIGIKPSLKAVIYKDTRNQQ